MKIIHGLSRCLLTGFILLTALPVFGASKPGASDAKAPAVMAPPTAPKVPPVQRSQALPKGALPDLVVTGMALDSACRLIVTVKNIGPGGVDAADFQRATLKIVPGGARAVELSMAKLAPGTAGLQPGAEVVLTAALVLESSSLVIVEADSRGAIAETNEGNNRMDRKLSPRCAKSKEISKGKPVKAVDAAGVRMIKPKQPAGPDAGGSGQLQYFSGTTRGIAVVKPAGGQTTALTGITLRVTVTVELLAVRDHRAVVVLICHTVAVLIAIGWHAGRSECIKRHKPLLRLTQSRGTGFRD